MLSYYSQLGVVISRHVTKMAVKPFDVLYPKNPMLYLQTLWLSFIESELGAITHCRKRNFLPFCFCDLDLDQMTFIQKLRAYILFGDIL